MSNRRNSRKIKGLGSKRNPIRGRKRFKHGILYRDGIYWDHDDYYDIDDSKAAEYIRQHRQNFASSTYMGVTLPGKSAQINYDTVIPEPDSVSHSSSTPRYSFEVSGRVRNKMIRYSELMIRTDSDEEIVTLNDELFEIIKPVLPWKIEIFENRSGLVFNFPNKSKYGAIRGAGINFTADNGIMLAAVLFHTLPFDLDFRRTEKKYPNTISYGATHLIQTAVPDAANKIIADKSVKKLLDKNINSIQRLHFEEETVFALLNKEVKFTDIADLILRIFRLSKTIEKYGKNIKELMCFNCGDKFDPAEEYCSKCGATRPNCVVCLLDLQPSEEEQVIKLPCCGAYAHAEHINSWLSKDYRCPNCQKNLAKLMRKLS